MKLSISLAVASFLATLTAAYPNPSPASEARMPPTMRPILEARDTTAYHYPSPASEARMPPTMRPVLEPR
ncbi:hypothetical protein UCDDS831_g04344 [Diplodia seriata]|uniref:Uncharacterized protein n=1 Tax=Diplodia seriata TaxID=420778 RepID=A0A0G2EG91_9PEZI|nr:hypothetical protein UCDDS831_g04344 [Diplodia seriata]